MMWLLEIHDRSTVWAAAIEILAILVAEALLSRCRKPCKIHLPPANSVPSGHDAAVKPRSADFEAYYAKPDVRSSFYFADAIVAASERVKGMMLQALGHSAHWRRPAHPTRVLYNADARLFPDDHTHAIWPKYSSAGCCGWKKST